MSDAPSRRGLDWLNFFAANVQTGFGPFIAVYLTVQAWTESQIGLALSIGTVAAMVSQVPAGALVDALRNKRKAAFAAVLAITGSALIFAFWPARLPVAIAEVLHGFASCVLTPAIAAISLALVGRAALGERLGRNARFASIGNGLAAAVMGACGTYVSERAVFLLTAALSIPSLIALRAIRPRDLSHRRVADQPEPEAGNTEATVPQAGAAVPEAGAREGWAGVRRLFLSRGVLVFSGCAALFTLANAAMLPLAANEITLRAGSRANLIIAACIVVPQGVVALASPWVGHLADRWGRRPVLLLGFSALPIRGVLLALMGNPYSLVAIQALDGVSGAALGVLLPLISADLTRGTNRFNLCMGVIGLAIGVGATLSTTLAGAISQRFGHGIAFLGLGGAGLLAVLLVLVAMPETRLESA